MEYFSSNTIHVFCNRKSLLHHCFRRHCFAWVATCSWASESLQHLMESPRFTFFMLSQNKGRILERTSLLEQRMTNYRSVIIVSATCQPYYDSHTTIITPTYRLNHIHIRGWITPLTVPLSPTYRLNHTSNCPTLSHMYWLKTDVPHQRCTCIHTNLIP